MICWEEAKEQVPIDTDTPHNEYLFVSFFFLIILHLFVDLCVYVCMCTHVSMYEGQRTSFTPLLL